MKAVATADEIARSETPWNTNLSNGWAEMRAAAASFAKHSPMLTPAYTPRCSWARIADENGV
jgi:hypothetical protein